MSETIELLAAGLDVDEQLARAAIEAQPVSSPRYPADGEMLTSAVTLAMHHARYDPPRILRELEAKRKILARWQDADAHRSENAEDEARAWLLDSIIEDMAGVYSDRPGYPLENGR